MLNIIERIYIIVKNKGIGGLFRAIRNRLYIQKSACFSLISRIVCSKSGLEIGGPSAIFSSKNIIPIYSCINQLDNCNFSAKTVWEGNIKEGETYSFSSKAVAGQQFVLEATDLKEIKDESYDFLLSSHMIEHTANPIKALKEWIRVVKTDGHLILVIPHKDGTFDHKRPVTTLSHMIEDYNNNIDEGDLTHLDEILELHDLSMDIDAGTFSEFQARSEKNMENRCLHHHVFNTKTVGELLSFVNLEILCIEAKAPMHIIVVAKKNAKGQVASNEKILQHIDSESFNTPFPSDKVNT